MYEAILEDLESAFPTKMVLTAQEICTYLGCEMAVLYNWNKRSNPSRRPPTIKVGKELRYQRRAFARWLVEEQGRG